jgi:hypothetical protein
MKKTILSLAIMGLGAISATATTITFAGSPVDANRIEDNVGNLIDFDAGSVVTAGIIDGGVFTSLVATLGSNTGSIGIGATDALNGLWNGATSNNSSEADGFESQFIAVRVVSSGGFAVFTTDQQFQANGNGVGDSATLGIDQINGVDLALSAPGSGFSGNLATVGVIPEPSSTLLLGLGGLGLLIRRKR